MFPSFYTLRLRPYETQVLLLIAFLGSLRLVVALVVDVFDPAITLTESLTDAALMVIFGTFLVIGIRSANFKSIHPALGIALIILLALNFIEFGGATGTSRFNYYCGIFVVILLYTRVTLVVMLSFQIGVLLFITVATYYQFTWTQPLKVGATQIWVDFIFAVVLLGILSYYLKVLTMAEIDKLNVSNERLRQQVKHAKEMNARLVAQGKELEAAQAHLEEEVRRRTQTLGTQQEAIEKYIHMNTSVLQEPVSNLNRTLEKFTSDDTITTLLHVSKNELNAVLRKIKDTLEAREELHRTKIKPS